MATFNEKFPRSVTLLEQRNRYFSRRGRSSDAEDECIFSHSALLGSTIPPATFLVLVYWKMGSLYWWWYSQVLALTYRSRPCNTTKLHWTTLQWYCHDDFTSCSCGLGSVSISSRKYYGL